MKNLIIVLTMGILFFGCSKGGDDRLAEKEKIKMKEQLKSENANQKLWSEKLESDLNERKYFFEAIEGQFNGEVEVEGILFNLTLSMISNLPIDYSDRVRTLDEINFEIQNLTLNLNIKISNSQVPNSAESCSIEEYRPNTNTGEMNIISKECKGNIFKFVIANTLGRSPQSTRKASARKMAKEIKRNQLKKVDYLHGVYTSSVSTQGSEYKLKRVE